MLRWGFLEILFLRSRLNGGICLLPTLAFPPPWDEGGEGGTLEVRASLGTSLLTFVLLFFPLGRHFITFPPPPPRLDVGTSELPHS